VTPRNKIRAPPIGTQAFPYKSPLTGVPGNELADGYEASSGKQWTQQLGASMSLLGCRLRSAEGKQQRQGQGVQSPRR